MKQSTLFSTLVRDEDILKALERIKFTEATPVQAASIGPMQEGGDVLVQAPTGTGKTCAFSIPMISNIDPKSKALQGIVLAPTRELALQIAEVMVKLTHFKPGIRITTIYGGEHIDKQFAQLRKKPQIVVATPGRLIDHIQRRTIKLADVNMLVLDEADRMLDMGFRPDLNRILEEVPETRQTALFSATLSPDIMSIAKTYQKDAQIIRIKQDTLTVESVDQYYTVVQRGCKNAELVEIFRQEHPKLSIVFTNTKRMAEKVVDHLTHEGYRATYLHGDLRQGQRNRVMRQYRTGRLDVLVATDVAARGIDVDNIDMVVNYDLPREFDSYIHRIGRTGRANETGVAHTLIYRGERREMDDLIRATKAKMKLVPARIKPSDVTMVEDYFTESDDKSSSKPKRNNSRPQKYGGKKPAPRRNPSPKAPRAEIAGEEHVAPNFPKRKPSQNRKPSNGAKGGYAGKKTSGAPQKFSSAGNAKRKPRPVAVKKAD